MATELLVEPAVTAGRALLARLDASEVRVSDAFWKYSETDHIWKLYLATDLSLLGIGQTARRIREVLDKIPEPERGGLLLQDIFIAGADFPVISYVRNRYRYMDNSFINKTFFPTVSRDEPIVFRLNQPVPSASESTTNA